MIRLSLLLAIALILSGCASLSYPLPKCNGYSRRPLNSSMWQWEGNRDLKSQRSNAGSPIEATPYMEQPKGVAAFDHLDIDGSYRPCAE